MSTTCEQNKFSVSSASTVPVNNMVSMPGGGLDIWIRNHLEENHIEYIEW